MSVKANHAPRGNPCKLCGLPATAHRPMHKPHGDPCTRCGCAVQYHRKYLEHASDGDPCTWCGHARKAHRGPRQRVRGKRRRVRRKTPSLILGVDGEGQGRAPHVYTLLAVNSEDGTKADYIENKQGLGTKECFEFLLKNAKIGRLFGYSLGYDWTKILVDVPAEIVYKLFRPELRLGSKGPRSVKWEEYRLNLLATKFVIHNRQTGGRCVVWDIWKFFRGAFVTAL